MRGREHGGQPDCHEEEDDLVSLDTINALVKIDRTTGLTTMMNGCSRTWTTLNLTYKMYGLKIRDPDSEQSAQLLRCSSHVLGSESEQWDEGRLQARDLVVRRGGRVASLAVGTVGGRSSSWVKEVGKRQKMFRWRDSQRLKETMGRE